MPIDDFDVLAPRELLVVFNESSSRVEQLVVEFLLHLDLLLTNHLVGVFPVPVACKRAIEEQGIIDHEKNLLLDHLGGYA